MRCLALFVALGCLCASGQPVITQGPVVDAVTYSSARITWLTDQPANTQLRFGLETLDGENTGTEVNTLHSWYLSGLAAATTYTYQACSNNDSGEICSDPQTLTTADAPDGGAPALPEPPRVLVDTSIPQGPFGYPFIVDQNCSNLPEILSRIASLSDSLNYEIQMPAGTACTGVWMFPARPAHTGWIVIRTAGNLPPEGVRIGTDDRVGMARFVTDALPGLRGSPQSFPSTCVPGYYMWANSVAGMGLHVCKPYDDDAPGAKFIAGYSAPERTFIVPEHGYTTGDIVRIAGTGQFDGAWQIVVYDSDRFALNGTVTSTKAYQSGGTVTRNNAWQLVLYRAGLFVPDARPTIGF